MEDSVEDMEEKWLWPVAMGKFFKNAAITYQRGKKLYVKPFIE